MNQNLRKSMWKLVVIMLMVTGYLLVGSVGTSVAAPIADMDVLFASSADLEQGKMDDLSQIKMISEPATFQVAPVGDWVQSLSPWASGATISLTIADGGGGVLHTDSQTADGSGNFNFNLWDVFDLERGHEVIVSDGSTTKTHTVVDLFVDAVDVVSDTVSGRADAGAIVDVWVHGGDSVTATTDISGTWIADFWGITDLTGDSDGGSQQVDGDGDSTGVWWSATPTFQVAPDDEWVQSQNPWTADATVSLSIEVGGSEVYSDSQTVDVNGRFEFNLGGSPYLERWSRGDRGRGGDD